MPPTYPAYITKALAECAEPGGIAFTHELSQIPMDQLSELPLGVTTTTGRDGGFAMVPPTQEALRLMRTAMASMPEARKRPGVRMAAMASCLVSELGGAPMPSKIADRATRFGQLTIGDAYTLIFMLQSARQGGTAELNELDCVKCGEPFIPRLRLDDRPVNVYRLKTGETPDGKPTWGGPLPVDQTPHVVAHLKSPARFGDRECHKLVMRTPTWSAALSDLPRVAWDDDDSTALFEAIVQAAIVGDETGPLAPITKNAWRRSGVMAFDFDLLKVAAIAVAGGPPTLITITCPHKGTDGALGCEAAMAFPVGWDVADDFFSLA